MMYVNKTGLIQVNRIPHTRTVEVVAKPAFTGKRYRMVMKTTVSAVDAYFHGYETIQDALPELSDDEREFLMTGIPPEEFPDA